VFALLLLAVVVPFGGCSFLADEFGWLDRNANVARPDAPVAGTVARP
jgi:hypothetical protein